MKTIIEKIQSAIEQGNLLDKFFLQLVISAGYSNYELFPVQERYKQYLRLKRKYALQEKKYILKKSNNPKIVWICWLQGIENAPDIVRACYKSVRKNFNSEWKVIVLTEENIFKYIDMPSFIVEKWKKGIISNTHFSDLLRMEILIKYGGLWSDATVFYTDAIPKFISELDFFTFHHSFRYDTAVVFESWFIYSVPNYPLLLETRDMIYNYWKRNNKLKDYFLFHIFFTISTDRYPEYWKCVPVFSDVMPHILAGEIFDDYDQNRFEQIKKMSCIHKLSYKLDKEKVRNTNTFYFEIVKEETYEDENYE